MHEPRFQILPYATPDARRSGQPALGLFLIFVGLSFGLSGALAFLVGMIGIADTLSILTWRSLAGNLFIFVMLLIIVAGGGYVCVLFWRWGLALIDGRTP